MGLFHSSRFHMAMAFVWAALAIPSILWWKDSILWVIFISLYANIATHWSAYQGARSEENSGS